MSEPITSFEPLRAPGLPQAIRSRLLRGINGLDMHVLEAGFETSDRPLLLLLHGFPELAYSWRKIMLPLAQAGYHVVAPDQRGYGLTRGWDARYDGDVASFRMPNLVRDALGLVASLGRREVHAVIGHDFGSPVAAWCGVIRPDVFRSVVLMSAPFAGPPGLPLGEAAADAGEDVHAALARLDPPRKHYQWYYATREAEADMLHCPQGLHDFLRAYYHVKSADWPHNQPQPLAAWTATELARLPRYYVMHRDEDMAQTVAPDMPSPQQVAACGWLSDEELAVYVRLFRHSGMQGGLQWYRCSTGARFNAELQTWSGRRIDVPCMFVAGASDWGIHQRPGALALMASRACSDYRGTHLLPGAGHWVQQEQPQAVLDVLLPFLSAIR